MTKDSNPRRFLWRALLAIAGAALAGVAVRAQAQTTYYVEPAAAVSVGVDGNTNMTTLADLAVTGGSTNQNRAITNTTAPTGTARWRVREGATDTRTGQEFFRAYTPAYGAATNIAANATAYADFYMNTTGTSVVAKAVLYEYSDATGIVGAAKGTASFTGNAGISTRQTMNNVSFGNALFTVAAGNRLLVIYQFDMNNSRPAYLWGQAPSATPSGYQSFTVTEGAAGTITLANGTAPSNATVCAAPAVATYIDHFTLLASAATNVTGITTTFNANPSGLLSLLEVTNDAGAAQGSLANPSGLTPAVTGMSFAAPTGAAAQYRLRITPNAATTSSGSFTATVTGVANSGGFSVTGTDTGSATLIVDGAASPDVTGATATPTAGTVTANWTNPAAGTVPATDFGSYVVVLGNTVPVTNVPAKGTASYTANGANTIGADLIVCSGNIVTCAKTALGANQDYYLKIFTRDGCANWSAGVEVTARTPNVTTDIRDGTNPSAASRAPGGAETPLDAFTLRTSSGTDTVTSLTVTLAAGTSAGLSQVRIMSGAACAGTQYGSVVPAGDAVTLAPISIPITTTETPFYVCVTPRSHAAMPVPPGAVYAVTGTVTAFASTNAQAGTGDTASATVTIDNASSPDVTAASATGAATTVTASWTNPGAGVAPATDFGSYVVVLGNTVPVSNAPAEGTATYTANGTNTIGADLIVCSGNVATCQKTALGAGQTYHMRIFTRDTVNNWSPGVAVSATTTDARTTPVSLAGTSPSCTQVNLSAAYTGDAPTSNNTVTFARGTAAGGPFTNLATCTNVGGGTNPRPCTDGTVAASTTYYYRATFADANGIVGSASVDSGAVAVPACAATLAVTAGAMPAAANVTAGSSGNVVGRIVLTATGGTVTVSSIAVANTGSALAVSDVSSLALYVDASGAFVAQGAWSSTTSRYEFNGLALAVTAGSPVTLRVVLGVNIGATATRTFAMRVAVPADVTVAAPSTVSNTATLSGNVFTMVAGAVAGSTNPNAPMVSIINPGSGAVVSPNNQYKVQIRVFNPSTQSGIAGIAANGVQLSTDNGTTWPTCPGALCGTRNTRYDSGTPTVTGTVYEVVVTGQAPGSYTLRARASNGVPLTVVSEPVQVAVASANRGDGNLLVRDNSAQLCSDCHALQTHSSEAVGTKYGSWAVTCRDCHAPHGTRNVMLVQETITPPTVNGAQTAKNVGFVKTTGDSNAPGWDGTNRKPTATGSFVNSDTTGPCQVCHTRTQSAGAVARWRNTGNADTHYTAAAGTQACTNCHAHGNGFGGGESTGGAACAGCHAAIKTLMAGTDGAGTGSAASKHSLVGYTDSASDTTMNWSTLATLGDAAAAPANRSCVNMCHSDHPHDLTTPALSTHDNNLYLDPSTPATRGNGSANRTSTFRAKTDFDPTGSAGMCTKCHSKPIATGRPTITDAAYGASAHDFTSTAAPALTWQYTLHDGGTTQRNCTKCHSSRTEGNTPSASGTGVTAVHGTSDPSLLAGTKRPNGVAAGFVCYNCHGSTASPAAGAQGNRSSKDIQTQIAKTPNHPADADNVHDTTTELNDAAFGNTLGVTGRHSSCMDCHDPHDTRAGTHAVTTNVAGPPLEGAWGAQLSTNPAFWTAPAAGNFTKKVIVAGTDMEATLCFKCHSSYYGTLPTSPSGGYTETDTAREFNPNNAGNWYTAGTTTTWTNGETAGGFHPVLASAGNNLGAVNMANLVTTNVAWRTSGARNLMTCTDCHESDSTADPNGPHGSTAGFILRGPNTTWNNTMVATSSGMPAGAFCANCHSSTYANSRFASTNHTSRSNHRVNCWNCHARVPHGGPRPGILIAPAGANANVGGTIAGWDTTAPYWGLGTSSNKLYIVSYPQGQATQWAQGNCGCNGTGH